MLAIDEIRGRLAEVFSLKSYKIDHVLHGAIASAAVYGAMLGATVDQIESAIGLVVAHYVPFRAIRHGKQLSDSKGASAAISAEVAVLSMQRAMRGFVGPADIFRNPEAMFCLFEKPAQRGASPFDLALATGGDDFAVMGMHFKLGLYEHQSAGAIQGLMDVLARQPRLLESPQQLRSIRITIYEPAFHIIGDPAKRDPRTRQSADHSMVYIIATLLAKSVRAKTLRLERVDAPAGRLRRRGSDASADAPTDRQNRIPPRRPGVRREISRRHSHDIGNRARRVGNAIERAGHVPAGARRNASTELDDVLAYKFGSLVATAIDDPESLRRRFTRLDLKSTADISGLLDFPIRGVNNAIPMRCRSR